MAESPTSRTLKEARRLGFKAEVVERWNPHARRRLDLFGVIDIVALHPGVGILGIQATSATNHAARRTKALAEPRLHQWLAAGGRFELWSWGKRADGRWHLRREEIKAEQLAEVA